MVPWAGPAGLVACASKRRAMPAEFFCVLIEPSAPLSELKTGPIETEALDVKLLASQMSPELRGYGSGFPKHPVFADRSRGKSAKV